MSASNSLTTAIIQYIQLHQGEAFRINVMGLYDVKLKRWKKTGMKAGFSDIQAVYKPKNLRFALCLYIEVKIGKDKQSKEQKEFEEKTNRAGGLYFIARTLPDFITWFDKLKGLNNETDK